MSEDLDRIRSALAATSEQLESLREDVRPELAGVRDATERVDSGLQSQVESVEKLDRSLKDVGALLGSRLSALHELLTPVVKDAGEVREVVEPLQGATERVGRVADRLPGPGKKS
jgi:methyl-accepting chemotaxis protein